MDQEQMMKMMIEGNYGPLPGADSAAVCRQGADEGIVLLKNDGGLPIAEEKIALFGAGAVDTIVCGTGSGSVFPPYVINVEQGLTEGGYTITSRKWLDKFAAAGKRTGKKDLGMMAMSYGYVYVAKVCMGADKNQLMKAITEAEAYKGPSLIIAYAPCINHGINMGKSQEEAKKAVEAGYWPLYRYNPDLAKEGKNPFTLDSKPAKTDYKDFIMGEVRYASLKKLFPAVADQLFDRAEKEAENKYEYYKKLSELD